MPKQTRLPLVEERKRRQWSQQELADRLGTTRNNVGRWELGLTAPGPYFRAKLCELFGKGAEELGLLPEQIIEEQPSASTPLPPADQSQFFLAATPLKGILPDPAGQMSQYFDRGKLRT